MGKHKDKSKKHKSEKSKKDKKKHKKRERKHSTTSNSSSEDDWIEKESKRSPSPSSSTSQPITKEVQKERDEWLSLPTNFLTSSNHERRQERELAKRKEKEENKYDPGKCSRELNPYWKDGGDGLPSASKFKKPTFDDNQESNVGVSSNSLYRSSNWRKKPDRVEREASSSPTTSWQKQPDKIEREESPTPTTSTYNADIDSNNKILSDKEFNQLGAKLVKAEIKGDQKLINELKDKMESARKLREGNSSNDIDEDVILTRTDSKGFAKPIKANSMENSKRGKKRRVETHADGERVRYFADDDKYDLKQMFENEKFNSVEDEESEFVKLAGKMRHNDDMDEIFSDSIRKSDSAAKSSKKNRDKAVGEHQKLTSTLDSCNKCLQSENMLKHLMVSMGNTIYLGLPNHEPLTEGHCLLVPIKHTTCGTQLDENEWSELMDFRKALTRMFKSKGEDVVFFETANYLNRYPHMVIECIPLPKETGELAPMYFKKAIDESETEWSTNKKLVSLAGRNVRKAIPRGLAYFCVNFGVDEGYAHVIEDQQMFPNNFAQEIIGGMLDLHHSKWRKPKSQNFEEQSKRVLEFSRNWNEFNFT